MLLLFTELIEEDDESGSTLNALQNEMAVARERVNKLQELTQILQGIF